jgi:hypothetical protein
VRTNPQTMSSNLESNKLHLFFCQTFINFEVFFSFNFQDTLDEKLTISGSNFENDDRFNDAPDFEYDEEEINELVAEGIITNLA